MHRHLLTAALLCSLPAAAMAATGDLYQVTSDKANLRAGPSDNDNVRTQLGHGDQLIELRHEGNWYGVRVLRTVEEGGSSATSSTAPPRARSAPAGPRHPPTPASSTSPRASTRPCAASTARWATRSSARCARARTTRSA